MFNFENLTVLDNKSYGTHSQPHRSLLAVVGRSCRRSLLSSVAPVSVFGRSCRRSLLSSVAPVVGLPCRLSLLHRRCLTLTLFQIEGDMEFSCNNTKKFSVKGQYMPELIIE